MAMVTITVNLTHAEAMILLGTLRRELRCLWYAAQNPERRDRADLHDRREKLGPLVAICANLCAAAKAAEERPDAGQVLTWPDEHTGEPQYAWLPASPAIPGPPSAPAPVPVSATPQETHP